MARKFGMFICLVLLLPSIAACKWSASDSSGGRYQIVYSPHGARDTFLLDTETGQVWQLTSFSYLEGQPVAWDRVTRIDNQEDFGRFIEEHSVHHADPLALPPK